MMTNNIDIIIESVEKYIETYDIDRLLKKINILKYIIPIPDDYEKHDLENWFELEEKENIHWIIPNKDELTYLLSLLCISAMYEKCDYNIYDIYIRYNDGNICIDESGLDNEIEELEKSRKELIYDRAYVLPTKKYVGNCSKEFCEKIVEKFWKREYERIQYIDFPPISFKIPTIKNCIAEFKNLINYDYDSNNTKGYSNIIRYFHESIIFANVGKSLSPYDGWQLIKSDEEIFKDFYRNRLRCSDWFKGEGHEDYMLRGVVMENTYGIGLSTSRKYQLVTYFKPKLAKHIISKYLNDYSEIFDPFSGYSGRMIGALALNKKYIGQDLCEYSVDESKNILEFLRNNFENVQFECELYNKDSIKECGSYECLFTCPPYENIEHWPGVKSVGYNCDQWIDICLQNYQCERYVFVVDNKIQKYRKYIVETLKNTSHFASNEEHIIVINKKDLIDIKFDIKYGTIIESDHKGEYSKYGEYIYNIFNQKIFNSVIDSPIEFKPWIDLIYKKFNYDSPTLRNYELEKITLNENNTDVLLACSGGLDSIYQIFQLQEMGYNVILYHMKNANHYENMQAYKSLKELSESLNLRLITSELKNAFSSNYKKYWSENPIKNQMILLNMIDWCYANGVNKICMDGSWEFSIDEVTAGIDVADAPENYDELFKSLKHYVTNLEFIKTPHLPKINKIKYLDSLGLMKYVYSCLGPGKFNEYRHNSTENQYNIKLFDHNCGCYCRKCAHHNLLMHYDNYKTFPEKFVEKCWYILSNNSFASRNMLFGNDIPLEQKIKNLYVE